MKTYKVLSSSFRQYKALSSNTFELDKKINVISEENIKELVNSFENSREKIFFYSKHKSKMDEEREPIGEVKKIIPIENEIGLLAEIEWKDSAKAILDSQGFYPSIEFVGTRKESQEKVFWNNLQIKAIAAVEDPASKGVELLCASALQINLQGENSMIEKVKELLMTIEKGSEEEKKKAAEELKELLKNDSALIDGLIDTMVSFEGTEGTEGEEGKTEEGGNKNESAKTSEGSTGSDGSGKEGEPKKEDDKGEENKNLSSLKKQTQKSLSAEEWNIATEEYAREKGYSRCSAKSIFDTFKRASKLFRAEETIEQCLSAVSGELQMLDKIEKKTEEVNLSGLSKKELEEKEYEDVAEIFEAKK